MIIDEEAAVVVRKIFNLALDGIKVSEIASLLNSEKIETPSQYFRRKHPDVKKYTMYSDKIYWDYQSVHQILTKSVYNGTLESHKRKVITIGSKNTMKNEPIVVENAHEPIVSKEDFIIAQKVIVKRVGLERKKRHYPLRSVVKCGICKHSMRRVDTSKKYSNFCCIFNLNVENSNCLSKLRFPEEKLEDIVYKAICDHVGSNLSTTTLPQGKVNTRGLTKVSQLEKDISRLKHRKHQFYEKYAEGVWSKEEYLTKKEKLDADISLLEVMILANDNEVADYISEPQMETSFSNPNGFLTREMVEKYIKAVYIYDLDTIEVEFLN